MVNVNAWVHLRSLSVGERCMFEPRNCNSLLALVLHLVMYRAHTCGVKIQKTPPSLQKSEKPPVRMLSTAAGQKVFRDWAPKVSEVVKCYPAFPNKICLSVWTMSGSLWCWLHLPENINPLHKCSIDPQPAVWFCWHSLTGCWPCTTVTGPLCLPGRPLSALLVIQPITTI